MEDDNQEIPDTETVAQSYSDDQNDYAEFSDSAQDEQQFGAYPGASVKDSIFTFFRHVLGIKDSSKVANLDRRELGMLDLSVRNCEYLATLGELLHNKSFSELFMNKAEITLATSMSKKGWLPELVVSQKRFTQRNVQPMSLQQPKKGFLGLGGGKTETPQSQ